MRIGTAFRFFGAIAVVFLGLRCGAAAAEAPWVFETRTGVPEAVKRPCEGTFSVAVDDVPQLLIYQQPDRHAFRPDPAERTCRFYSVEVMYVGGDDPAPTAQIFFKDKDGAFYQSVDGVPLVADAWKTIEVELPAQARAIRPVGHDGQWCDLAVATAFHVGVKFYREKPFSGVFYWRNARFHGERLKKPLAVRNLRLPQSVEQNRRFSATFTLSREYFNAFDPEEIRVDYEIRHKGEEKGRIFPAFYNQRYRCGQDLTRETWLPSGAPFWELRHLAREPGTYELRLIVQDRNDRITTPWRKITVLPSKARGPVGISPKNPAYLAFADGTPFWPVGINIHSNVDLVSERLFRFGPRPDCGVADYGNFFRAAAAEGGINAVEVWMANWAFAIEWSASNAGTYGTGRYSLMNAARLDALLQTAEELGIYVHLVLDNHGKTATVVNPEWHDNPYNSKGAYAVADGGFMENAIDYFQNETAWKYYRQRNRYVAARWGAEPAIFGVEFWSEGDLTERGRFFNHAPDVIPDWLKKAAEHWRAMDRAGHLLTTHVCGDYNNDVRYKTMFTVPNLDYVVGDGYRDFRKHRIDQFLAAGRSTIAEHFPNRPYVVTEYGCNSGEVSKAWLEADVHSGLWSSFFAGYAGSPMIWWFEAVQRHGMYRHYAGLNHYLQGIDRSDPGLRIIPVKVSNEKLSAMAMASPKALYAWIGDNECHRVYPSDPQKSAAYPAGTAVEFPELKQLSPGRYQLAFFHTVTGEVLARSEVQYGGGPLQLQLPAFAADVALKLESPAKTAGEAVP